MDLVISVAVAAVLVICSSLFGHLLPMGNMLGGKLYQAIAIVLAIVISAYLNRAMLYMIKGNSLYAKKKYKDALEKYDKAYKTKRLSPDMEIYCGYILLKEGKTKSADEIFSNVAKRKLKTAQKVSLDTNMALLYWKKGELDSGIELLQKLWESSPSATIGGSLGALILLKARETGDFKSALAFCEDEYEKFTYDKTSLCNLAEAYYRVGNYEEAQDRFEELMDMHPTTPAPYYCAALNLKALGKTGEADEMVRKALRFRFSALTPISRKEAEALRDSLGEE